MRTQVVIAAAVIFCVQTLASGFFQEGTQPPSAPKPALKSKAASREADTEAAPAFSFGEVPYVERFSNVSHDLFEYTPREQTDLDHFTDMMTLNYYHKTTNGDALATIASSVLKNYRANKGTIIGAKSVPRTKEREAEHLIVVAFTRTEFAEVSFSRFRLHEGIGTSAVYSHRVYGARARDTLDTWVKKHGPTIDKQLMEWNEMPQTPAPE